MKRIGQAVAGVLVAASVGGTGLAQTSAPQVQAPPPVVVPKTWADSITMKGDLRYRYEIRNDDSKLNKEKETYSRELHRIRARLGAEAKVNDQAKVGLEFSTGGSDPISGNTTLGEGFNKEDFRLNLAFLDYNFLGDSPSELHAILGKMKNPFITLPDDLVWDGDLTPEGIAFKAQAGQDFVTAFANGGLFAIQERNTDDSDDTMMYGGQAAAKLKFMPEVSLTLGASCYAYDNIEGYDVIDWEGKNNSYGNSTKKGTVSGSTTNKAWATDFLPVVLFAQLDVWVAGRPLSFHAQELSNSDADTLERGHSYGVGYGRAKNPRTWEFGYSYAELEKDATLGMFTDSDRWGGGTDGQGHKFSAKYQLAKNLQGAVTYFLDEKPIADASKTKDYDRLQLDLTAAF